MSCQVSRYVAIWSLTACPAGNATKPRLARVFLQINLRRSFVMAQSASTLAEPGPMVPVVTVPLAQACRDLLELLTGISDGRSDQGRDHPVAAVLALAAAATVAGMKGYTAIAGWVADVPGQVLADLYMRA